MARRVQISDLMRRLALVVVLGCALQGGHGRSALADVEAPRVMDASFDIHCGAPPDAGPRRGWRHKRSRLLAAIGDPHHRGVDLIAATTDQAQTFDGKLTYGPSDKDLEDEDVELFACFAGAWKPIGAARTNSDGRFALTLRGDQRLPAGMRDVYLSVAGDRTGARLLAFVAPAEQRVLVSDVDGTLTESENEYPIALATGTDTDVHPHAAAALREAAKRGVVPVYISARGDRFTHDTRTWLAMQGFPRGPIHLPRSIITKPGKDTVAFKTAALRKVAPFSLVAGLGNRATDVAAYTRAGLAPERIFIKLHEFAKELAVDRDAKRATFFASYDELRAVTSAL